MLTEKTIKIVIIVVLYLLFLLPLTSMETWDNPYTMHEHAVDMLVHLYDHQGMNAFNKSLNVYLNGNQKDSSQPIILLSVPDPVGLALNTDRVDFRPNEGHINTDLQKDYRPDDYLAITRVSK